MDTIFSTTSNVAFGHHRLVAILAFEGLVVDDYQCLRAQFVHIGDGSELEFFCGYGLSHPSSS